MSITGRPPRLDDQTILATALGTFATRGYEALSLRQLSGELGLSHSALGQRFGTKENLYRRAIDQGFDKFLVEIQRERMLLGPTDDDLTELRSLTFAFLMASARFPELGRLMSHEGAEASARFDYFVATVMRPQILQLAELLQSLQHDGRIHPVTVRGYFFLVAHGAEAPFTLGAMSHAFDDIDGELDVSAHVAMMTDFFIRSLTRDHVVHGN
jgi:AcrR family transcriptional regulator